MKKISVSNINGTLTSKRGKVIPVLDWKLDISQTPEKIKFRTPYTNKKKLPKGVFLDTDGLPARMTYTNPTTSGSADVMGIPAVGKVYSALFKIKGRQLKIFTDIYVTQVNEGQLSQIEFTVIGQVTIGTTKRTKKRRKKK